MKESHLVRQILDYTKYRHLLFCRNQSGAVRTQNKYGQQHMMRLGIPGSPDLIGCYKGKYIGVECKVGDNKPTELQESFGQWILDNDGEYWVVYTLDEFIKKLET